MGEHKLRKTVESLEGWELVDALDGRRWIGKVTSCTPMAPNRMGLWDTMPEELRAIVLASGQEHVTLQPALEVMPQVSALIVAPSLASGGKALPTWLNSPGRTLLGVLQLPALPEYTTIRCGFVKLDELPETTQALLLEGISNTIEAIEKGARDDARALSRA